MMVTAHLLGLPREDWRRLAAWSEAIVNLGNTISGGGSAETEAAFAAAEIEIAAYLAVRVAERRHGTAGDESSPASSPWRPPGSSLSESELLHFFELRLVAGMGGRYEPHLQCLPMPRATSRRADPPPRCARAHAL